MNLFLTDGKKTKLATAAHLAPEVPERNKTSEESTSKQEKDTELGNQYFFTIRLMF